MQPHEILDGRPASAPPYTARIGRPHTSPSNQSCRAGSQTELATRREQLTAVEMAVPRPGMFDRPSLCDGVDDPNVTDLGQTKVMIGGTIGKRVQMTERIFARTKLGEAVAVHSHDERWAARKHNVFAEQDELARRLSEDVHQSTDLETRAQTGHKNVYHATNVMQLGGDPIGGLGQAYGF